MTEIWRPEHSLDISDTFMEEKRTKSSNWEQGQKDLPWCELDCRWEEWPQFSEKEQQMNPD
eukprot:12925197-Prorocentrum_lima.AAC.1